MAAQFTLERGKKRKNPKDKFILNSQEADEKTKHILRLDHASTAQKNIQPLMLVWACGFGELPIWSLVSATT